MSSGPDIRIWGIRHHGPGSAQRVLGNLKSWQPDIVLVEGPADAQDLVAQIGEKGLVPPVAMLVYFPKELHRGFYVPFARFSPEWQAILWANQTEVPARLIDAPTGLPTDAGDEQLTLGDPMKIVEPDLMLDPLGVFARLGGDEDGERWWERLFEGLEENEEVFLAIEEMMTTLRQETGAGDWTNRIREAYMRKQIRAAVKEGFQKIAIVCGAYHVPALRKWDQLPAKHDNGLLKGRRVQKTAATWIPWSYDRLAVSSGYRAGVHSPAWYRLLFERKQKATQYWMVRAAQLLRKEQLTTSSAQVIDAVRLADSLASLRNLGLPGLQELEDAAFATFGQGNLLALDLIREQLVVGHTLGKVEGGLSRLPLQKDLEQSIKSARLTAEKARTDRLRKELDVRKASNLKASLLLHRLQILNIDWGSLLQESRFATGSHKENWSLKWKPAFALRIIEASVWGATILEAATKRIVSQAESAETLAAVAEALDLALKAQLSEVIDPLLVFVREQAIATQDFQDLLRSVPVLAATWRYGDTRGTDTSAIEEVINGLVPSIAVGLPGACAQLGQEAAKEMQGLLLAMHQVMGVLNRKDLERLWQHGLAGIIAMEQSPPLLHGQSVRLLFDQQYLDEEQVKTWFDWAVSEGQAFAFTLAWLEGFLSGSGLVLLHHRALWDLLNHWVDRLAMGRLKNELPLLRRVFSNFSESERRKLLQLAQRGDQADSRLVTSYRWEEKRIEGVIEVMQKILGKAVGEQRIN
ncbi:MAG: DUF5682 family protein [Bacteroidota bacterium]